MYPLLYTCPLIIHQKILDVHIREIISSRRILSYSGRAPKKKIFRETKALLYGKCISIVLHSFIEAGNTGVIMRGPDNNLRNCYPVIASIMVDYLEECMPCLLHMSHLSCVLGSSKPIFLRTDGKADQKIHFRR